MIRAGAALLLFAACADDHGPRLDTAAPASAQVGALVTISGERLCGESGDCEAAGGAIRIGYDNPVQAMIIDYADTFAQIRIPSITPIGETVLIATVNERASNALDFRVLAP
ncbi:MAG: hypothetical protein M4D80_25475 [Myxococcota bacterium]|nr:hypothetical protein [Deltaproteobacteria bacterium]MDQ3338530.1 hypothetical protein [Myxococcota bacterium]